LFTFRAYAVNEYKLLLKPFERLYENTIKATIDCVQEWGKRDKREHEVYPLYVADFTSLFIICLMINILAFLVFLYEKFG
jgi:hypothetical protein